MQQPNLARAALAAASLLVLYFVFQIFRPFLISIAVAAVLTSLSYPAFEWICGKLKGRRGWAALTACLAVTLVIILPVVFLLILLSNQVVQVYSQFQEGLARGDFTDLPAKLQNIRYIRTPLAWLGRFIDLKRLDLAGSLAEILKQASVFLLTHSTAILTGAAQMIFNFFLMIITMFFLFRDGDQLRRHLRGLSPLSDRYAKLLAKTFREVARATVVGSLTTAFIQGMVAGLIFWILGVPNALFWGALCALFSLVPVVGAALVWAPWAGYLLLSGHLLQGVLMLVLQAVVAGSVDNLLRPLFIQGRVRMHTLVIFFSIMGGVGYFGVLGMVFGPILVALGLTLLEVYRIEFQQELPKVE
jgi:predicted PurR-regulated permease PerM